MHTVAPDSGTRVFDTANTPVPKIALLGHVPFTTLVSAAGSGATRSGETDVNRWRADATRDNHGQWCYVKDLGTGAVWSAGHQPVCAEAASYRAEMTDGRVTFHRRDGAFETLTEITVVPGALAETRRVSVTNLSDETAEVELTSYQEIVLAPHVLDRGHRGFYNLFVQTEWIPASKTILAMRRPRSPEDEPRWCGHTIAVPDVGPTVSCETDRARFLGRGRTSRNPVAMGDPGDLSGTVGAVLDPVFALRRRLVIPRGGTRGVIFTTFVARDRDQALELAQLYHALPHAERAFDRPAEVASELNGLSGTQRATFQEMAGLLLYGTPPIEPLREHEVGAGTSRADLALMGITGEWPLLVASLDSSDGMPTMIELLTAHWYWKLKGFGCDLVILCGDDTDGRKLDDDVVSIVAAAGESSALDRPQGIFVRRREALEQRQLDLLGSVARIDLQCSGQTLTEMFGG